MRRATAARAAVAFLIALAFAVSAVSPARAESPWSIRLGPGISDLEGALGAVYPESKLAGSVGVAWRTNTAPWRARAGLATATHTGRGEVPIRGWVFDPNAGDFTYTTIGTIGESWTTTWVELPVQVEWVAGASRARPYVGAGAGASWRVSEHDAVRLEVPTRGVRRFGGSGALALGLEFPHARGVARVELGYAHGLGSLYEAGKGPQGSWSAWALTLDVGI